MGISYMVDINSQIKRARNRKIFRRSMLASAVMAVAASSFAQDDILEEEVVVTGTRANLQNAQDIKREADTFVDSISAQDIGVLPDRSVLEAIQRLPGVSVERFAGPDDPDHFSVEGSGAIIRGMTATRSEFNGRDSFSANSGRGLSFQDVSPELMAGVDVYKNQTADMIEGGIGGTISLRTRKPFDSDGQVMSFNLDYSYGDLAEEWTPTASALYSNRWETGVGEFGFLVNVAHSELMGESHGIQSDAYVEYYASDLAGAERFETADPANPGTVWIPNASNLLKKTDDRQRDGGSLALQFQNLDETFLATFQYIGSEAQLAWHERAVKYQGGYFGIDNRPTRALVGTEMQFTDQGLFESGFLVNEGGRNGISNRVPSADDFPQWGHNTQFDSRVSDTTSTVEDFSLNLQWQVNDKLELEADFQYVEAETVADDLTVHTATYAMQDYDATGTTPTLRLIEPWNGARDANPEPYAIGYPGFSEDPAGDSNYFQDPTNYWWRSAMDHYERSEGDSTAVRLDGTYFLDDSGLFKSVKAGIRYAKREQTVRTTDWNWGSLAPEWRGPDVNGPGYLTDPEMAPQASDVELIDWSDFMHGDVAYIEGDKTIHATEDFVRSLMRAYPERTPIYNGTDGWNGGQPGQDDVVTNDGYSLFEPSEINEITETNKAIYVRLDFGGDDDLRYSGNVGVRFVRLNRQANGHVQFPDLVPEPESAPPSGLTVPLTYDAVLAELDRVVVEGSYASREAAWDDPNNNWNWVTHTENWLNDTTRGFGNNVSEVLEADEDFDLFLPSFNIKVELTDDLVGRFAFAKAAALPDIGDVRNQLGLGITGSPALVYPQDSDFDEIPVGVVAGSWSGSGGNPYLKPMMSTQYDVSLEWYFADVGQLTGTIFHKDLSHMFIYGAVPQTITNPGSGVTQSVFVTTTRNGGDAKMDGFELAYQQFFDTLPSPWDGFGIQATYTYIDASGVPNNEVDVLDEEWISDDFEDTGVRVNLDTVPLQGQSDETVNLVGMYEKYDWSVRLAYNWRSRYLLTTRDVISKAPLWYDDHGQLDGSVFYNVNDNLKVGLQATNLTNSQSETIMRLNNEGMEAGRSWFMADRRVALVLQGRF